MRYEKCHRLQVIWLLLVNCCIYLSFLEIKLDFHLLQVDFCEILHVQPYLKSPEMLLSDNCFMVVPLEGKKRSFSVWVQKNVNRLSPTTSTANFVRSQTESLIQQRIQVSLLLFHLTYMLILFSVCGDASIVWHITVKNGGEGEGIFFKDILSCFQWPIIF